MFEFDIVKVASSINEMVNQNTIKSRFRVTMKLKAYRIYFIECVRRAPLFYNSYRKNIHSITHYKILASQKKWFFPTVRPPTPLPCPF